jgi:hypothetical protein
VKTVSGQVKSQVRHSLATLSSSLSSTLASAAAIINDGDTAKVVDHLSTVKRRTAQLSRGYHGALLHHHYCTCCRGVYSSV